MRGKFQIQYIFKCCRQIQSMFQVPGSEFCPFLGFQLHQGPRVYKAKRCRLSWLTNSAFVSVFVDPEWFISDPIPDPDPTFQRVPDPIPDPDPDPTPDPDPVWIHTHTHKYLHTYTHIYTQTHKHTQTQTHIHIHTRTYTLLFTVYVTII